MREHATRPQAPPLCYAAGGLFLLHFLLGFAPAVSAPGAWVGILFALVLAPLVLLVEAPPAARGAGLAWAALAALAATLVLAGGAAAATATLGALALLAGAVWAGWASLFDAGNGRALGVAAAAAMGFSGLLALAETYLASDTVLIVRLASQLALALPAAWFVVLGRDLARSERRWASAAGPHAGPSAPGR